MSRTWVKLSTGIHTDRAMMSLPRETLGNWCLCLSLAGSLDEGGRLGSIEDVAWHLRLSEDAVRKLVRVMGGRIAERDGQLYIRDWADWQPPTTETERSRKHREAQRDITEPTQEQQRTGSVAATLHDDGGNVAATDQIRGEVEEEGEGDQKSSPPPVAKPAKPPRVPRPDFATQHPGAALYRDVIHRNANQALYEALDKAYASHGADAMRSVLHEWVARGYNPANVAGILDAIAAGGLGPRNGNGNHGGRRIGHHGPNGAGGRVVEAVAASDDEVDAIIERTTSPAERDLLAVKRVLESTVAGPTYRQWFAPLVPVSLDDRILTVRHPSPTIAELVRQRGAEMLHDAAAALDPPLQVVLAPAGPVATDVVDEVLAEVAAITPQWPPVPDGVAA